MTKADKKTLSEIMDRLSSDRETVAEILGRVQEKYEGMSEKAQESEKGEALQEEISQLEEVHTGIENAVDALGNFQLEA